MTAVTVATADLRNALTSVAPHADPNPDFPPLHRIRLTPDPHNITVTATNRYTAALAIASIWDDSGIEQMPEEPIDLSPQDVKEILTLFKPPKGDAGDEQPDATLRVEANDKHTRITDVSGLFPGKSLQLPRYATETNFTDIATLIRRHLTEDDAPSRLAQVATSGKLLGLFGAAPKAYNQPLTIEPTNTSPALLIACGESFLGLLMPLTLDDDKTAQFAEWRQNWIRRLTPTEVPT